MGVGGRNEDKNVHLVFLSASQMTKVVLQMVLRKENPPSPARSHLDRMQSMVSSLSVPREGVDGSLLLAFVASRPQSQGTKGRKGL